MRFAGWTEAATDRLVASSPQRVTSEASSFRRLERPTKVGHMAIDTNESTASPDQPPDKRPKLKKKEYEKELARLQEELTRLQRWIRHEGLKVVVIFEGRDAAGKGGVIKRITERLNPRVCPRRGPRYPQRPGEDAVVVPALRRRAAGRRRDGAVRPQLVQPRPSSNPSWASAPRTSIRSSSVPVPSSSECSFARASS